MAIDNNIVESKGIYFAQDFSLNQLSLLTANGNSMELRKLLVEFSYYEDIYNFVTSGHITLLDAQGFIEKLQLTGNEFIKVNFSKTSDKTNAIDRTFRVYKSGARIPSGNQNSELYTLYFCSEELLLSEQNKVSKSYRGKKISEIIQNILTDDGPAGKLKINKKRIQKIEETTGMYDFIIPKFKPFEAISWLSSYARPQTGPSSGADMLFFETKDGYNFRSLQSMFSDAVYSEYTYSAENVNKDTQSLKQKFSNVIDYEISKPYDILNEINAGSFANRIITIDTLTRSYNVTDFNYLKYKGSNKTLNEGSPTNNYENRLNNTIFESAEGALKLSVGNSNQQNVPYVKQQGGVAKDIFVETYIPNRTAQISLANYTTIKAIIPGDPGIAAGKTIKFNLLSLKPSLDKKELDMYYSGKYLVSAVRHIINPAGSYQTILELSKDSSPQNYPVINSSSTEWKKAIKE